MKPTDHFFQHHDLEPPRVDAVAFRPAWRVRSQLDGLLIGAAISPREWFAASTYRRDWDVAHGCGLGAALEPASGPSSGGGDYSVIRRVDALAALRMVRRRIGPVACYLLEACVVDDMEWRTLAGELRVDPKTARMWTIIAIQFLADTTISC